MSELDVLKDKIRKGVKRHYDTMEGETHRKKLSLAMKKKWKELKREAEKENR